MFSKPWIAWISLALFWTAVTSGAAIQPAYTKIALPPNPTEAQTKEYLRTLAAAIIKDFEEHLEGGSLNMVSVRVPRAEALNGIHDKLAEIPISHLAVICKAGIRPKSPLFEQLIADSLAARRDYRPEDKPVVLQYAGDILKLIVVIDRMNWFDVNDPAVLAAWKRAKRHATAGVLDPAGFRFAAVAARHGLTDALIALANTARLRATIPPSPERDMKLKTDIDVLQALVPGEAEGLAIAHLVRKQKDRLAYDAIRRIYLLQPIP